MCASAVSTYCPHHFASLPSIQDAQAILEDLGGVDKVESALAAVAAQHASSSRFGLQLLHRHSKLADDEVMLTFENTSIPVRTSDLSAAAASLVHPIIWGWRADRDAFGPVEFVFAKSSGTAQTDLDRRFAEDVISVLKQFGMERVLGIAVLPLDQTPVVEMTYGRANIVFPEVMLLTSDDNTTEVLWPFSSFGGQPRAHPKRKCVVRCYNYGRHGHLKSHSIEDDD